MNAFAFPNGVVYVHTGILARMENEAQLATLLAHEMTHSTHRHAIKSFRDIKNKTAFLATVRATLGGLTGGTVDILGAVGTMAAVTGYSRELEAEADMEGLKRIVNAGYNPYEAPKLFIHLKKEVEEEKIKEPFFFGTHPRLQERIENYKTFLKTYYPNQKGIDNKEIFLEKVYKVIIENANLDLKAGRYAIAQRGIEKYLTIKPNEVRAYYLLGEIFRQRGDKEDVKKAKEQCQKAVSIDPSYSDPYKGLGLIHYKQGEKHLAKKYFEQYLSLSPEAPDKAYIENYIKTLQ